MQWLIANMWIAMAAATVLGLLFGFAMRGLLVGNRIQKAEVEREIAKTELTQSKAEVEALYAAQRKQKEDAAETVGGGDVLVAALDERERRITSLGEELASAREELQALQSRESSNRNTLETAGAAVAGAVAGAVLSDGDQEELTGLRDRNAWLEERVGALETDIAGMQPAVVVADNNADAVLAESVPEASVADEKTRWQASYLRTRVDALEAKLIAQSAEAEKAVAAPVEVVAAPDPQPVVEPADTSGLDEEVAQLRWRNRYLEGRLAYFEQPPEEDSEAVEPASSEDLDVPDPVVETASEPYEPLPQEAEESEAEPVIETDAAEQEVDLMPETEAVADVEQSDPSEEVAEPEVHPSEAMLAELDGKQPEQLDCPSNGGDDLTTITGIGPRIAEVLNGLGIWTFAQIAEWKPEHETWIENHLSFKGRVSRENWVGQAKDFLVTA